MRIDERDRVSIHLTDFNFVSFAAEYTIEKTVAEAYVTLNTLWSQALGLGRPLRAAAAAAQPCPSRASFEDCVVDWMWALVLTSRRLDEATARHRTNVALSAATITAHVIPDSDAIQTLRAQLLQVQSDTLTRKPGSMEERSRIPLARSALPAFQRSPIGKTDHSSAGDTRTRVKDFGKQVDEATQI